MEDANTSTRELTPWERLKDRALRSIFHFEDFLFRQSHGLDLKPIFHEELTAEDPNSLSHATAYYPTTCRDLREIVSEARKTLIPFDNFIDIGCGKGKACIYASRKIAFKKVIGIDFSQPIIDIAIQNNRKLGSENVTFIQGDAVEFQVPDGNNLIFMNNPFDSTILEAFIRNNNDHFRRFQSIIAYVNDRQRASLLAFGFETLYRNQRQKSLYRYNPSKVPDAAASPISATARAATENTA